MSDNLLCLSMLLFLVAGVGFSVAWLSLLLIPQK